jgi:E3 ubiquitin-protein ligase MGRN1
VIFEQKSNDKYKPKVIMQKVKMQGKSFELSEIYGLEAAASEDGEMCVICLSSPKSTIVMPCRHHCLCFDCAETSRK